MEDAKQSTDIVPGATVEGSGPSTSGRRRISGALQRRIDAASRQPIVSGASRGARYHRYLSGQIVRLNPGRSRRSRRVELRKAWLAYVDSRYGVGPVMARKAWGAA